MPTDVQAQLPPVFSLKISLGDGDRPIEGDFALEAGDRKRVAAFLRIESLESVALDYRLTPAAKNRFRLSGQLRAELTQLCGVTLDPVAESIDEPVDLECWPEKQIAATVAEEDVLVSDLPEDPPAPIVNGAVDLGALAIELLASAINPYPRKSGAALEWEDEKTRDADGTNKLGPFAGLSKLKPKE
ncbi:MAG: DUF177 domain-containing protein [Rhodomicrobiaceae bacterium]